MGSYVLLPCQYQQCQVTEREYHHNGSAAPIHASYLYMTPTILYCCPNSSLRVKTMSCLSLLTSCQTLAYTVGTQKM